MNVYEKLLNVQSTLKCNKNQYNSLGKYNYRSCEDIVESVKPLLKQYGLLLTLSDDVELVCNRFYIKATAIVMDIADGTYVSVTAYAREEETKKGMDGAQVTGTSSSYARKYALNGLFAIDDTKDADATNDHGKGDTKTDSKSEPKPEPKAEKAVDYRKALIAELKVRGINSEDYAMDHDLNHETTPETFKRLYEELVKA